MLSDIQHRAGENKGAEIILLSYGVTVVILVDQTFVGWQMWALFR